jgi:cytoskeletal protein CcmA (bactofilin family)
MIMSENKKTDAISSIPTKKEERSISGAESLKRFGDNANKMIIGSGSNFNGSDIKTDEIEVYGKIETNIHAKNIYVGSAAEIIGCVTCEKAEIHGSVYGAIQVNGKADIKKTAQILGSFRYQTISVAEGAAIFSNLHCTNADQSLLDKIGKLKKTMNIANVETLISKDKQPSSDAKNTTSNSDKEAKKKRYFFQ